MGSRIIRVTHFNQSVKRVFVWPKSVYTFYALHIIQNHNVIIIIIKYNINLAHKHPHPCPKIIYNYT